MCSLDLGAAVILLLPAEEEGLDVFERVRVERRVESARRLVVVGRDDREILVARVDLDQQDVRFCCTGERGRAWCQLLFLGTAPTKEGERWTDGGPLL